MLMPSYSWPARWPAIGLTLLMLAPLACLAEARGAAAGWRLSADGREVIDERTGQAWSRCVEGMHWTGKTCAGAPTMATHKEALALASQRRQADGLDWRLPRVTDLRRLAQDAGATGAKGAKGDQGGEADRLFPGAPRDLYWAGTARVDTRSTAVNPYNYGNIAEHRSPDNLNRLGFLHGWAVDMRTGEAQGDVSKRTRLPVRLVRVLQGEAPAK